jgi:hypothetical protein
MSIEPIESEPRRRFVPVLGSKYRDEDQADGTAAGKGGRLTKAIGVAVGVSLAAVIVAPVTLSATHLIEWASSPTGLDLPKELAWLVFIALDLAAVACIGMVVLCAMKGESAGAFDLATWAFAFASAFANYTGSTGAGTWFFPAMSIAGPTLLHMVLAKVKRWARISEGTQLSARPKFGVRWVPGIAFRETARAWAAARREGIAKAADAIAFVREVDVLAEMSDDDAVRYARAAAHTADPHQLRQWLTSRGKNVTQTALPSVALPVAMNDDIAREGAPMREIFAPMPEKLRAPREALGLPAAPEPRRAPSTPTEYDYVREMAEKERAQKRQSRPRPDKDTVTELTPRRVKGDPTSHPKWGDGVAEYRRSVQAGNPMSQRELADFLKLKNRTLAAKIQAHVSTELGREG